MPIILILVAVAAGVIAFAPIAPCAMCDDLWKIVKGKPIPGAFPCPCCGGSTLRVSIIHEWLPGHAGHLEELNRFSESGYPLSSP